jgi:hypothetical protein
MVNKLNKPKISEIDKITNEIETFKAHNFHDQTQLSLCLHRVSMVVKVYYNKKFWEELIAYFPWYDKDRIKTTCPTILLLLRVYSLPR